jgi:NAD(P)-dependent dehydrogenase (short-subunit alcohol dehydrogenase family)
MFQTNLQTAQVSLRMLIPRLHALGGSIVAIGSRSAKRPWEGAGAAAYTASKAALVALVSAVAQENLATGVRINALLPSTIDTPNNRQAMPTAEYDKWVSTREIAEVTEFLLSHGASGVTGAAIPVYGRL